MVETSLRNAANYASSPNRLEIGAYDLELVCILYQSCTLNFSEFGLVGPDTILVWLARSLLNLDLARRDQEAGVSYHPVGGAY